MSVNGIVQGQGASTDRQAGTAATQRTDDRVRHQGGFSAIAAQNYASTEKNRPQAAGRTGAQPLNASGRGQIVNIIV